MDQTMGTHLHLGREALVIDEDPEHLDSVSRVVQAIGYSIQATSTNSYEEGIRQLASGSFDVIVVGQGGPDFKGRCVLEGASEFDRRLPVIVVARDVDMACDMEAMQLGALDYIAGPFGSTEVARVVKNYATRSKGNAAAQNQSPGAA
jgi:DNA-binding response OmpR family regulator